MKLQNMFKNKLFFYFLLIFTNFTILFQNIFFLEVKGVEIIDEKEIEKRGKEFEFVKNRMAKIYQEYEYDAITTNKNYSRKGDEWLEIEINNILFAKKYKTAQCSVRSKVLGYDFAKKFSHEYIGFSFEGQHFRNVSFTNVPFQVGHTAIEVFVDGQWVFFDPTYGIYFTDLNNNPISYLQAKKQFPEIQVFQFIKNKNFNTKKWFKYSPDELKNDEIKLIAIYRNFTQEDVNGFLNRTYFNVDSIPELNKHIKTSSLNHFKGGKIGFWAKAYREMSVHSAIEGKRLVRIEGKNLRNIMIDIDPVNIDLGGSQIQDIRTTYFSDNELFFIFDFYKGGSLIKIRPLEKVNSTINAIKVYEI